MRHRYQFPSYDITVEVFTFSTARGRRRRASHSVTRRWRELAYRKCRAQQSFATTFWPTGPLFMAFVTIFSDDDKPRILLFISQFIILTMPAFRRGMLHIASPSAAGAWRRIDYRISPPTSSLYFSCPSRQCALDFAPPMISA